MVTTHNDKSKNKTETHIYVINNHYHKGGIT